uniref:SOCS box domain-containing protein n=1 Tax=Plectus sambesii TaxID=2011161 RepID=A0A914WJN4_9BILA
MGNAHTSGSDQRVGHRSSVGTPMTSLVRQMHLAVMRNDLQALLAAIQAGVDVNHPWDNPDQPSVKDGVTALSEAISLNHIPIAKCLIDNGAAINSVNAAGWTPLMKASYHGRSALVSLLIEAGSDVNARDKLGNSCLHICAQNGHVHGDAQCVRILIQSGANPNARNLHGFTVLHVASAWASRPMVSLLLAAGAELDSDDKDHCTPLFHCMRSVLELRQQHPTSVMTEAFRRQKNVLSLLLEKECDSLGLASFLALHPQLLAAIDAGSALDVHYQNNRPESLLHVCRMFLRNRLGFTNASSNLQNIRESTEFRYILSAQKVKSLAIPDSLKTYLCRRLLVDR